MLVVRRVGPQPTLDLAEEGSLHALLDPVQGIVGAAEREVIPVDDALYVQLGVMETTGTGCARREPHFFQSLSVQRYPAFRSISDSVQATPQPPTHSRVLGTKFAR